MCLSCFCKIKAYHEHQADTVYSVVTPDSATPSTAREVLSLPEEERDLWIISEDAEWDQILLNAVTLVPVSVLPLSLRVIPPGFSPFW